jgi:hypothetical protein
MRLDLARGQLALEQPFPLVGLTDDVASGGLESEGRIATDGYALGIDGSVVASSHPVPEPERADRPCSRPRGAGSDEDFCTLARAGPETSDRVQVPDWTGSGRPAIGRPNLAASIRQPHRRIAQFEASRARRVGGLEALQERILATPVGRQNDAERHDSADCNGYAHRRPTLARVRERTRPRPERAAGNDKNGNAHEERAQARHAFEHTLA